MPIPFTTLCTVLAILAVGAAAVQLASAVAEMQRRLERLETPPSARGRARSTTGQAMFSALYPEQDSATAALRALPGSSWLGIAAVLMVALVATSALTERRPKAPSVQPESTLVRLQGRVDSIAATLTVLRDSLRRVEPAHAAVSERTADLATGTVRRPAVRSATVLPAAPRPPVLHLDSAPTPRPGAP